LPQKASFGLAQERESLRLLRLGADEGEKKQTSQ